MPKHLHKRKLHFSWRFSMSLKQLFSQDIIYFCINGNSNTTSVFERSALTISKISFSEKAHKRIRLLIYSTMPVCPLLFNKQCMEP